MMSSCTRPCLHAVVRSHGRPLCAPFSRPPPPPPSPSVSHPVHPSPSTGSGADSSAIALDGTFRLYWTFLNAAYVLEFFLQTLVKKGVLPQGPMLALNALLMLGGTLAALPVLARVWFTVGAASLGLNLVRRGHDLQNTSLVIGLALLLGVPHWP
jgi:hypothetical protein